MYVGPSCILHPIVNENCKIRTMCTPRAIVPVSNFPGRASVSRWTFPAVAYVVIFQNVLYIIVMHTWLSAFNFAEDCKISRRIHSSLMDSHRFALLNKKRSHSYSRKITFLAIFLVPLFAWPERNIRLFRILYR